VLSDFVRTDIGRRRHFCTPIGPHLDAYLIHRRSLGFAEATIAANSKWATLFGEYLIAVKRKSLADLDEVTISAFEAHYRRHPRRSGPKRTGHDGSVSLYEALRGSVRSLLEYLRSVGVTKPAPACAPTPHAAELEGYVEFLRVHRGFAQLTLEQHERIGTEFLGELERQHPRLRLSELTVDAVEGTAVALASGRGRRCRQIMTSTLESFIRYLRSAHRIPATCTPFLPRMKTYALSSLPDVIPASDVDRAVESIDRSDEMGLRDYALVLLVATYGLRASEVAALRGTDIDWRHGVMRVRQTKTRRTLDLPLMPRVRDALIAYLRIRSTCTLQRHLFLKVHAPHGSITRAIVYVIVKKTLKKAGIEAKHYGPHALRHARASALIRDGKSLKVIGDLLGHRVPEATLIYCKVAVEELRTAALELPEVKR
jgi:site-specific recombinase XerD